LSSENLHKRPAAELDYLFRIYKLALDGADELLERLQVNFTWIGNRTGLPDHLLKALDTLAEKYTFATSKTAIFAINYGGRDEIIRGVRTLAQEAVDLTEVTIDQLSRSMDL
jgi:undecaprenyl diphosphate synthase